MSEGKWCYSFNEENFEGDFNTREEAIEEAKYYIDEGDYDQDYVWVGQTKEISIGVNVDWMLENISENAYDQVGEYAEDFLSNVTLEHQKILEERMNNILHGWMKEFKYSPSFYTVTNVEQVFVSNEI